MNANEQLGLPRDKMRTIEIGFDIDGTLRSNTVNQDMAPVANEDIRNLLIILSKFKNVKIHVWSGSGELYARQVAASFGIDSYIDSYSAKQDRPHIDIAIDDIQDTALGHFNLIVKEK